MKGMMNFGLLVGCVVFSAACGEGSTEPEEAPRGQIAEAVSVTDAVEPEVAGFTPTETESSCVPGVYSLGPVYEAGCSNGCFPWGAVTIPLDCKHIEIKVWGDGGGPGADSTAMGGGGGYAYVRLLNDHPRYNKLRVRVGSYLPWNVNNIYSTWANLGGEGGYVQWVSPTGVGGPMVAVAGGGGGGGIERGGSGSGGSMGKAGGAEQTGETVSGSVDAGSTTFYPTGVGGTGGSSTGAGVGGAAYGGVGNFPGNDGGGPQPNPSNNGGAGGWVLNGSAAGNGGGGYYGGGGGGLSGASNIFFGGGGGGGGNFADGGGATVEASLTMPGFDQTPGNPKDADRCQKGIGCLAGEGGTPATLYGVRGRVVIRWW